MIRIIKEDTNNYDKIQAEQNRKDILNSLDDARYGKLSPQDFREELSKVLNSQYYDKKLFGADDAVIHDEVKILFKFIDVVTRDMKKEIILTKSDVYDLSDRSITKKIDEVVRTANLGSFLVLNNINMLTYYRYKEYGWIPLHVFYNYCTGSGIHRFNEIFFDSNKEYGFLSVNLAGETRSKRFDSLYLLTY